MSDSPETQVQSNKRGKVSRLEVLLLSPGFLLVLICVVFPVAMLFARSVYGDEGLTWSYFRTVLTRPQYVRATLFTLGLAGAVTVLALAIAMPVCAFIATKGKLIKAIFVCVVGVSFAISGLIRTISWQLILSRSGLADTVLQALGITDGPADLLYTRIGVMIGTSHVMITYAMIVIYAGMTRVERDYILAARSLGASPLRTFLTAYWPQIQPSVINAGLLIFMLTTGFFVAPALLGGPNDSMLGNIMLSDLVNDYERGANLAAAAGVVLTLALSIVSAAALYFGRHSFVRQRRNR